MLWRVYIHGGWSGSGGFGERILFGRVLAFPRVLWGFRGWLVPDSVPRTGLLPSRWTGSGIPVVVSLLASVEHRLCGYESSFLLG